MTTKYPDAGVFVWAVRARNVDEFCRAMEFLDNPDQSLVCSIFVKLEVLAKPTAFKNEVQVEAYNELFTKIREWVDVDSKLIDEAYVEACKVGLGALDALHVACALKGKATELVTTEKSDKALHRCRSIKVTSIHP